MSLREEIADEMCGEFGDGEPNLYLADKIINKVLDAAVEANTMAIMEYMGKDSLAGLTLSQVTSTAINKLRGE